MTVYGNAEYELAASSLSGITAAHHYMSLSHRAVEVWGPFLCGHQVTVAGRVITVHVMAMQAVSTPSPSPAPQKMETSPGTWKSVAPS